MADGGEIAALFATLGLKVNQGQWQQGTTQIGQTQAALGRLGAAGAPGLRQAQTALGQLGTGASTLSRLLGGVAPAANQAGAAAESAGRRAASGFDAARAAIKGYLLYLGGHFGYEKLIKFNEQMETSIISLSAVIEGNLGGSYQAANSQAKELYDGWQKFSTKTPVQTADLLEFGKNIAAATFAAGGKVKDLQELTQQGVIAAQVLAGNRGAGYASLEITEMLMGNVSNRMMMARQILGFVKMTEEQFRELDAKGRLAVVKKALNSDAFKDAAAAFSSSFVGVTSTMWDKINIGLGKVGSTLFERLKGSVAGFNEWFDEHAAQIEEYGKRIGTFLADAFDVVTAAIGFVIDAGNRVIAWLGKYLDTGRLVKSLMIALGALMTAFAIESTAAWIAATWPILAVIAAVTAVIYAVETLMDYPGGVEQAFSDAFDAVSDAASDLWAAIKDGLRIAFDAAANLPVVKQLLWALDQLTSIGLANSKPPANQQEAAQQTQDYMQSIMPGGSWLDAIPVVGDIARARRMISGPPEFSPSLPASGASAAGGGVSFGDVHVGDIHVSSPNADPVAVADEVHRVFEQRLGDHLRRTMDEVA